MNDLLHKLIDVISSQVISQTISERNKVVNVEFQSKGTCLGKYTDIQSVLNEFPNRDYVQITFVNAIEECLSLSNINSATTEENYNKYINNINLDLHIEISIEINKKVENQILSVYNLSQFNKYILELDVFDIIAFIELDIQDKQQIIFEIFDRESFFLATKSIVFKSCQNTEANVEPYNRHEFMNNCRKNSNIFCDFNNLPLPQDFHFIVDSPNNPYKSIFQKIESLLSLMYISDNVHFSEDNKNIYCCILGKRMNEYKFDIEDITYNEVLYDIYMWIFTSGNIVDKVTLTRNLLSLHCRAISLKDINVATFESIKANFSLYQKENVNKYLELKNSMSKFLGNLIEESKKIVLSIVSDLGKNIIAFFSYILTIFLTKIISKQNLDAIFTKEVTYISYLILIGSVIYIIITNLIVNYKVKKLDESYNTIKANNDFFKNSLEYNEIFDDNKIKNVKDEISHEKRMMFILWGILLLIIFILIEYLSQYAITRSIYLCMEDFVIKIVNN